MNRKRIRPFDDVQTLDQDTPDGLYRIVSVSFKQLFASIHRKIPQEHDGIPNIVLLVSFKLFPKRQKLKKNETNFSVYWERSLEYVLILYPELLHCK